MSLSDALDAARPPKIEPKETSVPKGWEPGITWSNETETGSITTPAMIEEPDEAVWDQILQDFGPKAKRLEIIDSTIEFNGWNGMTGKHTSPPNQIVRMKSYRAKLRRRREPDDWAADIESLCNYVRKRKPPRKQPPPVEDIERAFLVVIADWQAGKNEGEGAGSEQFVERVLVAFDRTIERLAELKRNGRPCQQVVLACLGDLVEGCRGMSNASQEWTTDLTRREQIVLVVDLLVKLVDLVVDAGYIVTLTGVAGNHGEHRNAAGKAFTTPEDNDDLLVIELAGKVFAGNPERYKGVSVYLPEELSMSLDIAGVICGFYHGHIGSAKTNTLTKLANWWTGQIVGNGPTAPASILFSGHYHHLFISEGSGRTHIQAPAMDGGSRWFREATGKSSAPGFLTMTIGGPTCGPRGFDDLRVS
jgi:hypothetical protein